MNAKLELFQLESIPNDQPPPQIRPRSAVTPAGLVSALETISGKTLTESERAKVLAALNER